MYNQDFNSENELNNDSENNLMESDEDIEETPEIIFEKHKREFINSLKLQIQQETGQNDLNIEIHDDIMNCIIKSHADKEYLNFGGGTNSEKRFNESVSKNCSANPVIFKENLIQNGEYKIIVKGYVSNYKNFKTRNSFLYYYYNLIDLNNGDNNIENWEVVSDNEITRNILEHLGMSDQELELKYMSSYEYRKKLCDSIDIFWDQYY